MNDDLPSIEKQIAVLSRGIFINRCLLVFIAVCVAILLFLPRLARGITDYSNHLLDRLIPYLADVLGAMIAIVAVALVAAYIVARRSPESPKSRESSKY